MLLSSAQPSHHSILLSFRRFGLIDGLEVGELLGRGSYGRVYKGRWNGALVAIKVVEHRVVGGKAYDLSREPLLR